MTERKKYGPYLVKVSRQDKVLFSGEGTTKDARTFAHEVARWVVEQHPGTLTLEARKERED